MPPGRSQQIATCLNLMGDWRDSVRSQRSEKTDAVRVCRKTSGWTLCFDERGRNTWIATKCYCLLTQARQWVTASGVASTILGTISLYTPTLVSSSLRRPLGSLRSVAPPLFSLTPAVTSTTPAPSRSE